MSRTEDAGTDVQKVLAAKAGSITVADSLADTIAKMAEHDATPRRGNFGK